VRNGSIPRPRSLLHARQPARVRSIASLKASTHVTGRQTRGHFAKAPVCRSVAGLVLSANGTPLFAIRLPLGAIDFRRTRVRLGVEGQSEYTPPLGLARSGVELQQRRGDPGVVTLSVDFDRVSEVRPFSSPSPSAHHRLESIRVVGSRILLQKCDDRHVRSIGGSEERSVVRCCAAKRMPVQQSTNRGVQFDWNRAPHPVAQGRTVGLGAATRMDHAIRFGRN